LPPLSPFKGKCCQVSIINKFNILPLSIVYRGINGILFSNIHYLIVSTVRCFDTQDVKMSTRIDSINELIFSLSKCQYEYFHVSSSCTPGTVCPVHPRIRTRPGTNPETWAGPGPPVQVVTLALGDSYRRRIQGRRVDFPKCCPKRCPSREKGLTRLG